MGVFSTQNQTSPKGSVGIIALPYLSCLWKQKGQMKSTSDSSDCQELLKPHPFAHTILASDSLYLTLLMLINTFWECWQLSSGMVVCQQSPSHSLHQQWCNQGRTSQCHMLETQCALQIIKSAAGWGTVLPQLVHPQELPSFALWKSASSENPFFL